MLQANREYGPDRAAIVDGKARIVKGRARIVVTDEDASGPLITLGGERASNALAVLVTRTEDGTYRAAARTYNRRTAAAKGTRAAKDEGYRSIIVEAARLSSKGLPSFVLPIITAD